MNTTVNELTTIPLWWVGASLPVVVGLIYWLCGSAIKASSHGRRLNHVENKIDILMSMKEDLAVIKYKLNIKE